MQATRPFRKGPGFPKRQPGTTYGVSTHLRVSALPLRATSGSALIRTWSDSLALRSAALQVGVVGQQLVDAGTNGELAKHRADGDAGIADAGKAAHPVRVDGDSLLGQRARVTPSFARYRGDGTN